MKKIIIALMIVMTSFLSTALATEQSQSKDGSSVLYTTTTSYRATYQGKRYISGVYENTWMTSQMANPETKAFAYVYDKEKARNAALNELTDVTTLAGMKKMIQNGKAILYSSTWKKLKLTEAFFPPNMTSEFYLDKEKNGIVLVFQPGDLAPYSEGVTYVVVEPRVNPKKD